MGEVGKVPVPWAKLELGCEETGEEPIPAFHCPLGCLGVKIASPFPPFSQVGAG